LAAFIQVTFFC